MTDFFDVAPLQLLSFQTLLEGLNTTVSELTAQNNLNSTQSMGWSLDTGEVNITSTNTTNISNQTVIIIATNYSSSGVYATTARINATPYNDTMDGVVVV